MCGIVVMKTAKKAGFMKSDVDMFKTLLLVNSLRGAHSTGVFGTHKENVERVDLVKVVGDPYALFNWSFAEKFFQRTFQYQDLVVGHGRYATRGSITADNAHPFKTENITLVHNGGITNYHQLRDSKKHADIEVDSHLVAALIEEHGAKWTLEHLQGAFTLVWYDKRDGTTHVARNKERPLFVAKIEKQDTLVFVSEECFIDLVVNRMNLNFESFIEVPPMQHLIYEKGSIEFRMERFKEKPRNYSVGYPHKNVQAKIEHKPASNSYSSVTIDGLALQDELILSVEDARAPANGDKYGSYLLCKSPRFPHVTFRCWMANHTVDDIILSKDDHVKGVVTSIMQGDQVSLLDGTTNLVWFRHVSWLDEDSAAKALMIESIPKPEEELADETLVTIPNFELNVNEQIALFRLRALSQKGCGWCDGSITEDDLKHSNEMMLQDWSESKPDGGTKYSQVIICRHCTEGYSLSGNSNASNLTC